MTSLIKLLFPDPDIPMRTMTISSGLVIRGGDDFPDIVEILDGRLQDASAGQLELRECWLE